MDDAHVADMKIVKLKTTVESCKTRGTYKQLIRQSPFDYI